MNRQTGFINLELIRWALIATGVLAASAIWLTIVLIANSDKTQEGKNETAVHRKELQTKQCVAD